METLTLTTPETTPEVVTSDYRLVYLLLDFLGQPGLVDGVRVPRIELRLQGTNDTIRRVTIEGPEARTLMIALNTANLSTRSLQRRVLEYLSTSGRLVGTVVGSPD